MKNFTRSLEQKKVEEIISETLKKELYHFHISEISIKETEDKKTKIYCEAEIKKGKEILHDFSIESEGAGVVDALLNGIINSVTSSFLSLEGINFERFEVKNCEINTKGNARSQLLIKTKTENKFYFENVDFSVLSSTVGVIEKSINFLINSERTFLKVKELLVDAKRRRRTDLYDGYLSKLMEIVKVSSYEKTTKI